MAGKWTELYRDGFAKRLSSEKKALAMFHKNRVIQIRRTVDMDMLYHVKTEYNCADVGTRLDKIGVADVGPGSIWEEGHDWMRLDIGDLRMSKEEKEDYDRGLVFERIPEILTIGHVVTAKRVNLLEERAAHAKYLILPTKFSFPKTVRLRSLIS